MKHGPAAASSSSSSSVTLEAPCVVVNGDLARVERQLLPPHLARDFGGWSYSCSVVTFHWALSTRLHALAHHSIFLGGLDEPLAEEREGGKSRRQAWDWEGLGKGPQPTGQQGQQDQQGQPVNFYVHAPSRSDPSACPEGHDAITILVPCPTVDEEPDAHPNEGRSVVRAFAHPPVPFC